MVQYVGDENFKFEMFNARQVPSKFFDAGIMFGCFYRGEHRYKAEMKNTRYF